ncbi:MAG TPA: acyltransferase family protein, partial [Segetibacter sp.]
MNPFTSKKFRFYTFLSMVLLVFVHGYDLNNRYLQPFTTVDEPITFNTFTQYFLANGIFRFRIPMLFLISGYLFALHDDKPFWQRIKKRLRTLLLPYFLWSIIGLLIAVLFTQFDITREVVYKTQLQPYRGSFNNYSVDQWITSIIRPTSFQLWFLRCLF